jgi:glucosamine--fructose-6-phosphate aminotransferase (isomerizing)
MPDTPISTLAYTSTLQALGLLCEAILDSAPSPDWTSLPDLLAALVDEQDARAAELAPAIAHASSLDCVGGGASVAAAGEAALLVREALRLPATGMETREYLHGPLESVGEGYACLLFGGARERELAASVRAYGAAAITIGEVGDGPGFTLPALIAPARAVLEIVPVQLLVAHAAGLLGLELKALQREQPDTKAPR